MDKSRFVIEGLKYMRSFSYDGFTDAQYAVQGLRWLAQKDPEYVRLNAQFQELTERVNAEMTVEERKRLSIELSDLSGEVCTALTEAAGRLVFEAAPEAAGKVGVAA